MNIRPTLKPTLALTLKTTLTVLAGAALVACGSVPERNAALDEGHTDSVGSQASNQALSERRARAVQSALVGMGVPAGQLSTVGHGPDLPVAGNDSAGGRQMNRRVEVVFAPAAEGAWCAAELTRGQGPPDCLSQVEVTAAADPPARGDRGQALSSTPVLMSCALPTCSGKALRALAIACHPFGVVAVPPCARAEAV